MGIAAERLAASMLRQTLEYRTLAAASAHKIAIKTFDLREYIL
jgi:hypothetical protein